MRQVPVGGIIPARGERLRAADDREQRELQFVSQYPLHHFPSAGAVDFAGKPPIGHCDDDPAGWLRAAEARSRLAQPLSQVGIAARIGGTEIDTGRHAGLARPG